MARQNEIEMTSLRGKLARRVLTALLLIVPLAGCSLLRSPWAAAGWASPL